MDFSQDPKSCFILNAFRNGYNPVYKYIHGYKNYTTAVDKLHLHFKTSSNYWYLILQ